MRHGGDDLKPRGQVYLSAPERDRLIMALHAKGWSDSKIASYSGIGLSRRGVGMARERIAEGRPGRDPRG